MGEDLGGEVVASGWEGSKSGEPSLIVNRVVLESFMRRTVVFLKRCPPKPRPRGPSRVGTHPRESPPLEAMWEARLMLGGTARKSSGCGRFDEGGSVPRRRETVAGTWPSPKRLGKGLSIADLGEDTNGGDGHDVCSAPNVSRLATHENIFEKRRLSPMIGVKNRGGRWPGPLAFLRFAFS
ncbi:hypothetical protein SCOR_16290 [Sulfidibacter corallicola]